jgi:hypothetical protein
VVEITGGEEWVSHKQGFYQNPVSRIVSIFNKEQDSTNGLGDSDYILIRERDR